MARRIIPQSRFQGIAYSEKEGLRSQFLWAECLDYRSDPTKLKILPRTLKVSGTVVKDLIMCGDQYDSTDSYFYGDAGHIYKRTSSEVWSDLRTVSNSHGNGMKYFGEDQYLYYTSDTAIGRYGPMSGTKTFVDDFLGSQGGVPKNTHSLDLESGSSQYATAADHASLSITSDITIEGCFKMESLPSAGNQMVLVSKWNENGDQRSYKFDLAGVSARFGDGSDGALTISSNTTQSPIDSTCTGTAATYSLSATNASFAVGQKILVHQTYGTNAGVWEQNEIASYTAGTITTANALKNTYTPGAQVLVLKEYTNVTVNAGKTWTAKAWNGSVGGILAFLANGTVTVSGTISAVGKGFRHGQTVSVGEDPTHYAYQGEGQNGTGSQSGSANGMGGGGGQHDKGNRCAGGGGGGYASSGADGGDSGAGDEGIMQGGTGGGTGGTADLTTALFGGAGGNGSANTGKNDSLGGNGGGFIFFYGSTLTVSGSINASGADGVDASDGIAGSGGGAGGSILIKSQSATLGTSLLKANGGSGGAARDPNFQPAGGGGGNGRIHLDYYTSYSGTTSPTLDVTQDDTLVTTTKYQLRFSVSTDGTSGNTEVLSKTLESDPQTSQWYRYAVTWDASASQAEFFVDGTSAGIATGSKTSIYDSTAVLAIGASLDSSGDDENHFDGKVDDVRIWNDIRSDTELNAYKEIELSGGEAGLAAYYELDNSGGDSSANSNSLTLQNSPSYDADDVPFRSPTTRLDLDQSLDTSGNTYTLQTSISETDTHRQTFTPTKEPLKSVEVLLAAKGTGDWTLTVHDALNREIGSKTIANADLPSSAGDVEFTFDSPLRVVLGSSYHFHLTSTVADGTVTTTTTNDLETADFHTYFSFLVDNVFHPIEQITNLLVIGNGRYLASWDAASYNPHRLTFPSGYRVRCLGHWREFLVIGTVRGDSLTDYDQGMLFLWDGISTTYNYKIPVKEGGINAIASGDPLYFIAGYSGDLLRYSGGIPRKVLRMPNVETGDTLEINPNAITTYRALVHVGMAENSTSSTIKRGVYSYGRLYENLPETLSFDYSLSLGVTTGSSLEIGGLFPIGDSLFISWRNNTSYGVDSVTPSNDPFPNATVEFLITDANKIWAQKQAQVIRAYFKKLSSGDSVTLKYKIDRADSWTFGDAVSTADKIEARLPLPTKGARFNEFQVGIDLATTNSTSPEVYGWAIDIDDLQRERRT